MSDELTNAEMALLCSLEARQASEIPPERRTDLTRLMGEGFVEERGYPPSLRVTPKGLAYLGERGAGINEA